MFILFCILCILIALRILLFLAGVESVKGINKTPCRECKNNKPIGDSFCKAFRYEPVNDVKVIGDEVNLYCVRFESNKGKEDVQCN